MVTATAQPQLDVQISDSHLRYYLSFGLQGVDKYPLSFPKMMDDNVNNEFESNC